MVILVGFFANREERKCQTCTLGENCAWGSNATRSAGIPIVKRGFWAASAKESDFSGHIVYRCLGPESCLAGSTCADGRTGTACGDCRAGFFGTSDGPCRPCGLGSPAKYKTVFLLAFAAAVLCLVPVQQVIRDHGDEGAKTLSPELPHGQSFMQGSNFLPGGGASSLLPLFEPKEPGVC